MSNLTNLNKTREEILTHALVHVVFDGWSWKALTAAGRELDIESFTLKRAFPKGPRDLVRYFCESADKSMLEELSHLDINFLSVRERIAKGVKIRLQQNTKHKEATRKLLSYFALPKNIMIGAKSVYRTVDAIWYFAGDNSTDFNFYTKRGLLIGIYTSTLLYWLDDQSEDCLKTWSFLDRRISEVMKIPSLTGSLKRRASRVPSTLKVMRSKFFH